MAHRRPLRPKIVEDEVKQEQINKDYQTRITLWTDDAGLPPKQHFTGDEESSPMRIFSKFIQKILFWLDA